MVMGSSRAAYVTYDGDEAAHNAWALALSKGVVEVLK